jgi:hypothetical protein
MNITHYEFGRIVVENQNYKTDVIITPKDVHDNWWRKEGHSLAIEDLDIIISANPDVLVVGSGYYGHMQVPEKTKHFLIDKGIKIEVAKTPEAIELFNNLQEKYARIVAALHLTC